MRGPSPYPFKVRLNVKIEIPQCAVTLKLHNNACTYHAVKGSRSAIMNFFLSRHMVIAMSFVVQGPMNPNRSNGLRNG